MKRPDTAAPAERADTGGRKASPARPLPGIRVVAAWAALLLLVYGGAAPAATRTIHRCVRDGTVSLATAPEPGSRCEAHEVADAPGKPANLWGNFGIFSGTLYEREQDGELVYSTRNLPGSRVFLKFTVQTPPGEAAHPGLGSVGAPRMDAFDAQFRAAARATGVDDAWLRAIAHAESGFDAGAVSPKGAQGVMQLMPAVSAELGVEDPLSAAQSIDGGARHLRMLLRRFDGDRTLAAAAYNAGLGAVALHGGVPPFPETRHYLDKVQALTMRYREAMGFKPERPAR